MEIVITQEKRKEVERIQREFRHLLSANQILRATAQAINGVMGKGVIPRIKKGVKEQYNIKQKYLNRMAVVFPKAYGNRLYAGIKLNYSPIPIIGFGPKQTQSNISVSIHKGKTVVIHNSFIATMSTGHKGVYSRGQYVKKRGFVPEKEKTKYGKIRITELKTASPFTMGTSKSVADDVREYMGKEITARVTGILNDRVNKLKK